MNPMTRDRLSIQQMDDGEAFDDDLYQESEAEDSDSYAAGELMNKKKIRGD